jgi:nicotinate-nucleotide adenylyltransferase
MSFERGLISKAVGFYGGTFDPVHFGHLNLALEMLEKRHLDEIWFCPAAISPHRLKENPTPGHHRKAMLERALSSLPFFRVLDNELEREGPSYTVDTLRALKEQDESIQLFLILGEDAVPGFFSWHQPKEILKIAELLVGTRPGFLNKLPLNGDPEILKAIQKGLTITRVMEISSTEIRARLCQSLYCGHLVPKEVLDYIMTHRLYLI